MQIEAIYQDGRLKFTRPIHFKAGPVRLLIEVPPGRDHAGPRRSRCFAAPFRAVRIAYSTTAVGRRRSVGTTARGPRRNFGSTAHSGA